jgi:small subunit ribosomal protein S4
LLPENQGITGENLLQLLEARLDNTVYRFRNRSYSSWCKTACFTQAHFVNGEVVNIPSYTLKPGDVVSVRERSKSLEAITSSLAGKSSNRYPWLEWDNASLTGKFVSVPSRDDIPENIKEQLIVELYSK